MAYCKCDNGTATVEVRKRRQRIQEFILQGITDQSQLANILGVSVPTISKDQAFIRGEWLREDIKRISEERSLYIRRMLFGASQAYSAWERSKQNEETITTEYIRKTCPDCKGGGFELNIKGEPSENWCSRCEGNGEIMLENVVRRVTGQAGDPSLLGEYRKFMEDAAKIRGVLPRERKGKQGLTNIELHRHVNYDFSRASPELVLEAKRACLRLKESIVELDQDGEVVKERSSEESDRGR
jgi:hypothetical protein